MTTKSPGDRSNSESEDSTPSLDHKLRMIQLCDSFFPSGGFTLSHGLESWVQNQSGDPEASQVHEWIEEYLRTEILPNQTVILLNAHRLMQENAAKDLLALDRFYRGSVASEERREASVREGQSVRELVEDSYRHPTETGDPDAWETWDHLEEHWSSSGGTFPVTMGMVGTVLSLETVETGVVFLYSITRSITAAAMRIGVLNHFESQNILTQINDFLPDAIDQILDRHWTEAGSRSFRNRILAVEHEDAELRLFST